MAGQGLDLSIYISLPYNLHFYKKKLTNVYVLQVHDQVNTA